MAQILKRSPKIIEREIIRLLIDIKNAGLSYSPVLVHLAALSSYVSLKHIVLNRKKLSKFVREQENKYNIVPILMKKLLGYFHYAMSAESNGITFWLLQA